ncbi:MAG: hypothetical protein ACK5HT_12565 [Draconibacterium sp.]
MKRTKEALVVLLETGNKVVESITDDGKIDFGEGVGIAMKGVKLIGVFKSLPEIKAELQGATPDKITELVETFKEKFDLPNDEAEQKVEQGIEVLAQLVLMVLAGRAA